MLPMLGRGYMLEIQRLHSLVQMLHLIIGDVWTQVQGQSSRLVGSCEGRAGLDNRCGPWK